MPTNEVTGWIERTFNWFRKRGLDNNVHLHASPKWKDWSPCNVCSNLRGKVLDGLTTPQLMLDFTNIIHKAAFGCCTCKLLLTGVLHCIPEVNRASDVRLRACYDKYGFTPLRIEVIGKLPDHKTLRKRVEFYALNCSSSPWPKIGQGLVIPGDTSSQASLEQVRSWIRECQETHQACQKKDTSRLPKRVIQLIDFGDPPSVRLYESQNEPGIYLCLSHCWGDFQPIKTTIESLVKYKKEIPWARLSKTFQDAVIFTQKLGIQYLWIDSLCILQDSEMDWREQSNKMCEIYEGAFLTLFATKAHDGTEGLFGAAKKNEKPIRLWGTDPISGKKYFVHARPLSTHFYKVLDQQERQRNLPLLSRGWVYQERLMSRRNLHFVGRELSWECAEAINCECFGSVSSVRCRNVPKLSHSMNAQAPTAEVERRWRKIVSEYTRLTLTFSSDRLPALAGLATKMHPQRKGRYLAGLWEDSILLDLCWYTTSSSSSRSKCNAPTWSWASINSEVTYSSFMTGKVEFAKCIGIIHDPKQLSIARDELPTRIKLRGRISPMKRLGKEGRKGHFDPEPDFLGRLSSTTLGHRFGRFFADFDYSQDEKFERTLWFFRMISLYFSSETMIVYLVLRHIEESEMLYERVGFYSISLKDQSEAQLLNQGIETAITIC